MTIHSRLRYLAITLIALMVSVVQAQVYVANVDGQTVAVINPATNAVTTTIAVGNEPRNLRVNGTGSRVYVPNRFSKTVSVIDVATNTVVATVAHASFNKPYAVAITPDGSEVWVANKSGGGSSVGSVTIISTATNTVIASINNACFSSPESIAIGPTPPRAYVINRNGGGICIINLTTRAVLGAALVVGGEPRYGVVTQAGDFLYVSRTSGGKISKIKTSDNSITNIASGAGGTPRNMAISATKVYVALQNSSIMVIDIATNTVSSISFTGARSTYGVALVPSLDRGYVTDESLRAVHVFSISTGTEITGTGFPIAHTSFRTPRAIAAFKPAATSPVPTLSGIGLLLLVLGVGLAGIILVRRRQTPTN